MLLTDQKLTAQDRILLTAARLDNDELSSVSLETLVISCWKDHPTDFGMNGYTDLYPDTNRVIVNLSGLRGLVTRGLLERTGSKCYRITDAGRKQVKAIQAGERLVRRLKPKPRILSPAQQEFLARTICSGAHYKAEQKIYGAIEFKDAVAFWSLEGMEGNEVAEQLVCFATMLTQLEGLLNGAGELVLNSGMVVTRQDAQQIMQTHKMLLERFRKHLQILSKRKDD